MLKKQLAKCICVLLCICMHVFPASAQDMTASPDTLRLTIEQAEKIFIDSNLQLLAEHYNIQSNRALVEQARKWDNPVLNTDQNLYANHKFFDHSVDANGNKQGEVFVQVQQLIRTAGKRGRQVDLAQTNVTIAEWQFKTAMRELRQSLLKDMYTTAQLQGNAALYNDNMERLQKLERAMSSALQAGNIAKKEYLRVQALILGVKQDMTDNAKDLADAQAELKTLLRITGNVFIMPVVPPSEHIDMSGINLFSIMDTATRYNTDYNQQVQQARYAQQNVRLQKAMGVPDLTIGTEYDQASNYTPNYYGLAISLPIPILDRNRGNIKSARAQQQGEEALLKQASEKLKNDVLGAYQKLQLTVNLDNNTSREFYTEYDRLYKNIVESYNNRQISLIEFLEYFNDYQDVKKNQLQQAYNLHMARVEFNDVTGIDIIK